VVNTHTREYTAEPQHTRVRHPLLDAVWRAAIDTARGDTPCILTEDSLAAVTAHVGREDGWFIAAERITGRRVQLIVQMRMTEVLVLRMQADEWKPELLRAASLSMPGDWIGAEFLRRAALAWGGVE